MPNKRGMKRAPRWVSQPRPYIGPCRDMLELWFLEYDAADGRTWRRYFADGAEARAELEKLKRGEQPWSELKGHHADLSR